MSAADGLLLLAAGVVAGIINTLAGAGSLLTVPALVLMGLPGTLANGTNRVGVVVHNCVAAWRFHAEGVPGLSQATQVLFPAVAGSLLGAYTISLLPARTFEQLFAFLTFILVVPLLWPPRLKSEGKPWSRRLTALVFFGVGVFGGAFQAGVGLLLLAALAHSGHHLLRANSIKVVINAVLAGSALVVFVLRGQVEWIPGLVLAAGYALGAVLGVRLAVLGGEPIIRVFIAVSVVGLSTKMLGWW